MAPENCPEKFIKFIKMIEGLKFEETPNYRKLKKILEKCADQ